MKYTIDGRLDLTDIVVHDYEIDYARSCWARGLLNANGKQQRTDSQIRRNIAIGKLCGAYDPWPAMRWQALRVMQRPELIGVAG